MGGCRRFSVRGTNNLGKSGQEKAQVCASKDVFYSVFLKIVKKRGSEQGLMATSPRSNPGNQEHIVLKEFLHLS